MDAGWQQTNDAQELQMHRAKRDFWRGFVWAAIIVGIIAFVIGLRLGHYQECMQIAKMAAQDGYAITCG